MKISNKTEEIFSHAVALDQSGGMKNTVYAIGKEVFILNYDNTILLRFRLRKGEQSFDNPISFRANDYDSNEFYEENGKIVFVKGKGSHKRKKSCAVPDLVPADVKSLYESFTKPDAFSVTFGKDLLSLLDYNLSHMEFRGKKGEPLQILQRNIYSGAVIKIHEKVEGLLPVKSALPFDFDPIALRTNDFQAMFAFQESLRFTFNDSGSMVKVDSVNKDKFNMSGLIACCIYDELIQVKEAEHGGQK